jgi:hypothetical protein
MDELSGLSTRERAFVVACVRALGARAEAACARSGPSSRRYAAELTRDPARLAAEAERLGRAVPDGIEEIHPTWIEPPPPSTRAEAVAHLARRAYGHLVAMATDEEDPLERCSAVQLFELLAALGRRRVAIAFSGAPKTALARLCARLGEPAGSQLVAEVRQIAAAVSPAEVTAAQRALHHPGAEITDGDGLHLFTRVGTAWLGPALAARGGDLLRRLAQRLPQPVGLALLGAATVEAAATDSAAALAAVAALASTRPRAV